MAVLALLQPDARASARLTEALGEIHELVTHRTWDELGAGLTVGAVEGCVVDADHPVRADAEKRIAKLREEHPELAIIVHVDRKRRVGLFDLGGLGVDGLVTSEEGKTGLRSDVAHALSVSRSRRVARALRERDVPEPGPEALAWAVVNATDQPSVKRLETVLGLTKGGLRDALVRADLPAPAGILLWGRLLSAGARLANDQQSVEEVAFSLGYATSTSLARAMKTHTGYTPRQISGGGGLDLVLDALLARSRPSEDTPRGAPTTILGILGLLVATGCATVGIGSSGVDRRAVDTILESSGIDRIQVGVLAVDASTGQILYEHDAEKKFIPASNQKILVASAALAMLGPDYRFRTEIWANGSTSQSVLDGDLVLVGSGDPTLSERFWQSGTAALEALADSLRATGLKRVAGSAFVDVSAWDSTSVAPTREVEDLRYTSGATGGAFAIDEGEVEVVVEAGPAVGAPARIRWSPLGTDDYVRSHIRTSAPDSTTRVAPHYLPESRRLVLEGVAEYGTVDTLSFALRDPVRQASAVLARAIQAAGVELDAGWEVKWGEGEDIGRGCLAGMIEECGSADRLVAIESPPLSEILAEVLGPSQNWMTEQLLISLAAAYGEEGSWAEGVAVVEAFLFEHVGVDTMSVSARDGSGLSAYNVVTPEALVRVLRHMHHGAFAAEFRSAMAEPGEEGSTLERRLQGLEGRVFAKTGTISNVNSLSGYLVRENGQEVIFSILTNGSGLPASYVRSAIDDILTAIAR